MTDNTLDNGTAGGTSVAPSTGVQPGSVPADSGGGLNQESLLKRIAELEGHVRSLQSEKDKGVQKALDKVGSLEEQIKQYEKLRAKGLDQEDALYRLEMQQLLEERRGGKVSTAVPVQSGGGSPTQPATVDHTALLTQLGLDPNAPDVLAVVREGGDLAQQVVKFATLSAQKKAQAPTAPNPAQQVPVGGGVSSSERTIADVEADLAYLKKTDPDYRGKPKYRQLVEEHRTYLQRP